MRKILYNSYKHRFRTPGALAWKSRTEKQTILQTQRKELKALAKGFTPSVQAKYHLRVRFYLSPRRLASNLDNLLKEFNDIVFGKHRDQRIYSIGAEKCSSHSESVQFWIYELN